SDFWLLRRRCVVTHQDEKDKKRRKDTLSGVYALVNRGYYIIIYEKTKSKNRQKKLAPFRFRLAAKTQKQKGTGETVPFCLYG
ncbi:MAG: hypothetical protein Q4C32_03035, partial [Eubacteriales bacterium]|nr:hypothetical protein [Eubacteriales bacterium]